MSNILARVKTHLPEILIGLISLILVLRFPLPIWDDGTQFEQLSRSILRGEYALIPGVPSMYREPGYPLFRAMAYAVGGTPSIVLFLQAILAVATCALWRRVWEKLKPGSGWIGAWGTFAAYGYWLFARQHAYEVLLGFLLAACFWFFMRFLDEKRLFSAAMAGLFLGSLTATRGVFIFLWIPMALWAIYDFTRSGAWATQRKKCLSGIAAFVLLANLLPGAWIARNTARFNTFGIASRPGLILLARAIKTDASWGQYGASFLGTFTGDALIKALLPQLRPIDRQHTAMLDQERERIAKEQGVQSTDSKVDELMLREAKSKIFASPTSFAKYLAWSVVDDIRLVSLPSFTTPWGTMEPMFLQKSKLGIANVLALLIADGLNLAWLFGGLLGCYLGWRMFKSRFVLLVPYAYLLAIHAPLDNVVRFSAAIQPIIGAFVMLSAVTAFNAYKARTRYTHTGPTDPTVSSGGNSA